MNRKQRLGYILLGAGIMAVGVIIGQFITLDIEAQNNGVFDEIMCKKLTIVDGKGNKSIVLGSGSTGNGIIVIDKKGKKSIILMADEIRNSLSLYDSQVIVKFN